jgi:hypothetical protein
MLLGLVLIAIGLFERGWMLLAVWLGADFLALGIAHARGFHRILGKRPDGSLPLWSWLVFLLLRLYTNVVWQILRLLCRKPSHNQVTEPRLADIKVFGMRFTLKDVDVVEFHPWLAES